MEEKTTVTTETEGKTFTQEEVNGLIKERLDRAEKKWADKYAKYLSPDDLASRTEELQKKVTELGNSLEEASAKANGSAETISDRDATIADLEARVKSYETDSAKIRIALETGIPYELAHKLSGSTEDEIREDAKALLPYVTKTIGMPSRNTEAKAEIDGVTAAFLKKNPSIKLG